MTIKTLIAAAAIAVTTGFGTIATTTATAQAGEFILGFQVGSGQYNDGWNSYNNGWGEYQGQRFRGREGRRHCSPRRALRKARRMAGADPLVWSQQGPVLAAF